MAASLALLVQHLGTTEEVIRRGKDIMNKVQGTPDISQVKLPFQCVLAIGSFDELKDGDKFKQMDDHLKVTIAGTVSALTKLVEGIIYNLQESQGMPDRPTWDEVISVMNTNPLLEPVEGSAIDKEDKFSKEGVNVFKVDGSPDATTTREVKNWFEQLLNNDNNVIKSTCIDIETLGHIVAQTGATITDVESAFYKQENHTKEMMDIKILRFPYIDRPFFQVYRIRLTAWSHCERYAFVQVDKNGIDGSFHSRKYAPCAAVLAKISGDVIKNAVQKAEDLLNNLG